jgi:outer membrane lipoprotein SlyB
MKKLFIIPILLMTACAPNQGQNRYNQYEVGQQTELDYGKILAVKAVAITGENTKLGMSAGIAAGSVAGYQVGNGNGQIAGLIAGAIIGGIAGHLAEQELAEQQGYEYIIKIDGEKKPRSIVQYQNANDVVFKKGDKVMIQSTGSYQRVVSAE